ncbi:MAG: cbb3-type cytochrome oxidase assembly protein CcoS [Planctomycetota bacterium]|nr:cbb3-type cytochrome oxidase assembly protein CcoS [Planctomycetota bacterium]
MDVLIVLVFISIVFVGGAILLFVVSLNRRDFEHAERLSLLPLTDPSGETSRADDQPCAGAQDQAESLRARDQS